MKILHAVGMTLVTVIGTTALLRAHDPKPATPATPLARDEAPGSAAAAVDAFHAALAAGDREGALARLAPEVVIFEGGGAEMSREEYAGHHLGGDMEFVRAVKTEVTDRQRHTEGDVAWVLTRTHTSGRVRDRDIDVDGVETMVLRRSGEQWRIVHVHWSSHARRSDG
jgi:ketosteroid isomerase-like protein